MNNKVEIRGDVAIIFVRYQRREFLECLIDLEDLPKLQELPRSVSVQWREAQQTFYCYSPKILNGVQHNTYIHRLVCNFPVGLDVDHKDHNGLNNRKNNLLASTRSWNMLNRRGAQRNNHSSGIRGVGWDNTGKCWRGHVHIQEKTHHVGQFRSKDAAVAAVIAYRISQGCIS
jgi:hypothetical protein